MATVAGAHLGASIRDFYSLDFHSGDAPWWVDLVEWTGENDLVVDRGRVELPEGPRLGIELADDAREYVTDEWVFIF